MFRWSYCSEQLHKPYPTLTRHWQSLHPSGADSILHSATEGVDSCLWKENWQWSAHDGGQFFPFATGRTVHPVLLPCFVIGRPSYVICVYTPEGGNRCVLVTWTLPGESDSESTGTDITPSTMAMKIEARRNLMSESAANLRDCQWTNFWEPKMGDGLYEKLVPKFVYWNAITLASTTTTAVRLGRWSRCWISSLTHELFDQQWKGEINRAERKTAEMFKTRKSLRGGCVS